MKFSPIFSAILLCILSSCTSVENNQATEPYVVVLGIAQDGGYPQTGCDKECCRKFWQGKATRQFVTCIAVVDPASGSRWIFEATPDITEQLHYLKELTGSGSSSMMDGFFITHAHIGHYTGLMQLGHEAMGAKNVPVYVMPKMKRYLSGSGPWNQLVNYQNISLIELVEDSTVILNSKISVTPFLVPHREEYSETVGYRITGPDKSLIFIPDINKWEIWDQNILDVIVSNDLLLLDGSFYKNGEIPGRDMSEFPHPFIEESIDMFSSLPDTEKNKIYFIHLNHTNPAIHPDSKERKEIEKAGFNIALQFQQFDI